MALTDPALPPIVLMLDNKVDAGLNEFGLIPWWIENTSDTVLAEVSVQASVVGGGTGFQIDKRPDTLSFCANEVRQLSTAFKANAPGRYALRVSVTVCRQDAAPEDWTCPQEITVKIDNPDAKGRVNLFINESSLIKGDLPAGDIHVNSASVLKFDQGKKIDRPRQELLNQLPPEDERLFLQLVAVVPPGLGAKLDLSEFSRYWALTGRPILERFEFIDGAGRTVSTPVGVGSPYRLRLKSHRGGHITIISRGSSSRFMQLLPHAHYGQQIVQANGSSTFADDMLKNCSILEEGHPPNPALNAAPFLCSGVGRECALALVSPQPLRPAVGIFQGPGLPPAQLQPPDVRALIHLALSLPGIELGYHDIEVRKSSDQDMSMT